MKYNLTGNTEIIALIETIKNEILEGRRRIERTIENEKTTTYWNIRKYIHIHLLRNEDNVEYGDAVFRIISESLRIGMSTLYRAVQFYETYPEIFAPGRKLP